MTGQRDWGELGILALVLLLHFVASPAGEPWKNGDEPRHVMTGVFVHDAAREWRDSLRDPRGYAERYYAARPALGLLVWPPLFYAAEGAAMLALGPNYFAARLALTLFALWAFWEARKLYRFTIGDEFSTVALALFACAPLVVEYSRFVMLEVPTLAFVLAAINNFEAYLTERRARAALLACLFAACATLTRFDGMVVGTYFLTRLVATRRWAVLTDRPVVIGVVIALVMTVPYYAMTVYYYSGGMTTAAASGTSEESTGFLQLANFWLYPAFVPGQVGWVTLFAALVGLAVAARGRAAPLTALVVATYVTFVPLAEPEPRHAIYWVPALCGFAALGLRLFAARRGRDWGCAAVFLAVAATGYWATWEQAWFVRGYAEAAEFTLANRTDNRPVLFDGVLTANFVYQISRLDPGRTVPVLRGDKLLYAVLSDPHAAYVEFAASDAEVRERLHAADPEFVVVESPEMFGQGTPASERLRRVLAADPEQYRLVARLEFGTNHYVFRDSGLLIYRKLVRNPRPADGRPLPVLGLGRSVGG